MRFISNLIILCDLFIVLFIAEFILTEQAFSGSTIRHPRLILTPKKVQVLQLSIETTHENLWESALELADEFRDEPIPHLEDARNKWRYIGDTMPVLGLAYLMTGDQKYVDAAEKWIQAVLAVPEWKGSENLGRSSWVTGCALLYDWLYHELADRILDQIRDRLQKEGSILVEEAAFWRSLSNHLLIETTALGMIGLTLADEIEEARTFLEMANQHALQIIRDAPLDGSWGEGIQYWQYGLGYFLRFLEAALTAEFKDYYQEYNWLKDTGYFPIYFSLPEKLTKVINFSDCRSDGYLPAFLLYLPASYYRNGYFQDYGNKIQSKDPHKFSWLDFIAYDPSVQPKNITELPTLKHFYDNDFVTMRNGWESDATVIGFRCGPAPGHKNQKDPALVEKSGFGPGHGHPDINSFNIFSYGEWLAIDPGYTKRKETRNHNTIIVNNYGQAGASKKWLDYMAFEARQPAPAILRVESNSIYDYLIGDAGNIYVDEACLRYFRRHILFLKPRIVIILDDLETTKESKFEWLMNARDTIETLNDENFQIIQNGVRLWIHPVLPETKKTTIYTKKVQASDVRSETNISGGIMTTLNFEIVNVSKTRYLVVLCPLQNISEETPIVIYQKNRLSIHHKDTKWEIQIIDLAEISKPSDSAFLLKSPTLNGESHYYFVRTQE